MLANLHLIKLFICHTLREERIIRRHGALPKLEAACLDRVITEMRDEGFADDGLFPKIAEFFLPLTISEQELCIERGLDQQKRQELTSLHEKLLTTMKNKTVENNEQKAIYWTYDDQIISLEKELIRVRNIYSQERAKMAERISGELQQQQAQELQKLHQQRLEKERELLKQITELKKLKNDLRKVIDGLDDEIDQITERVANIECELTVTPKYVDKKLIKPARGLIMYGPPGKCSNEWIDGFFNLLN